MTPAQIAEAKTARRRARLVASLGKGGFLCWSSSPHVMWLAWSLAGGSAA